ncbi:hypothetical protein JNK13_11015 [bacterium]|nr:hypothetical protein [bacterium]
MKNFQKILTSLVAIILCPTLTLAWNTCGYSKLKVNYCYYMSAPELTILNAMIADFNSKVLSSGQIVKNANISAAPLPDNGASNIAVVSDAEIPAGYGITSWSQMPPRTVSYHTRWFNSSLCTEIVEDDALINKAVRNDSLYESKFKSALEKEFLWGAGVDNDTRFIGVMNKYPCARRFQSELDYATMDDLYGLRTALYAANGFGANWQVRNYADMVVYGLAHPTPGSALSEQYYRDTTLNATSLTIGKTYSVKDIHFENRGNQQAQGVTVTLRFSTDTDITANDYLVHTVYSSSQFPGHAYAYRSSQAFSLPDMPEGTYYVGLLVQSSGQEYSNHNNQALLHADATCGAFLQVQVKKDNVGGNQCDGPNPDPKLCYGCNIVDVSALQFATDGAGTRMNEAAHQASKAIYAAAKARKIKGSKLKKYQKIRDSELAAASVNYTDFWQTTYLGLPQTFLTGCSSNAATCTFESKTATIDHMRNLLAAQHARVLRGVSAVKKVYGKKLPAKVKKSLAKYTAKANSALTDGINALGGLPNGNFSCR